MEYHKKIKAHPPNNMARCLVQWRGNGLFEFAFYKDGLYQMETTKTFHKAEEFRNYWSTHELIIILQ